MSKLLNVTDLSFVTRNADSSINYWNPPKKKLRSFQAGLDYGEESFQFMFDRARAGEDEGETNYWLHQIELATQAAKETPCLTAFNLWQMVADKATYDAAFGQGATV